MSLLRVAMLVSMVLGWPGSAVAQATEAAGGVEVGEELVEIATLLEDFDGDTIPDRLDQRARVRGVVTVAPAQLGKRNFQAFIQDDSAGVMLFSHDLSLPLAAGDVVEASGVLKQFRGAVQLQEISVQKVGEQPLPEPVPISVASADSWQYMGRRVRVEGVTGPLTLDSFGKMRLTGDDGASISLYFPASVTGDINWRQYTRGTRIAATGVVSIFKHTWPYDGGFQLIVSRPDELSVLAPAETQWPGWLPWAVLGASLLAVLALLAVQLGQRRQRARQQELATLGALSAAVSLPDLDSEQLARRACDILTACGIVEAAMLHVFDERGCLHQLAASSADPSLASALDFESPASADGNDACASGSAAGQQHLIEARVASQGLTLLAIHPLPSASGTLGFLTALSPRRRRPSPMQERTLLAAVKLLALALENCQIHRRARLEQEELHQLAITDPLTRLYNRRFLDEYLRVQIPLARRRGGGLAFLSIDIDHFKQINDSWGHAAGDQVLVRVATEMRTATRSADLPVRMGGEEFLLVIAESDVDGAVVFAERLRGVVEATSFDDIVGKPLPVTISIGVALFGPHGDTAAALLRASDDAMYVSKRGGRNRVTVAQADLASAGRTASHRTS